MAKKTPTRLELRRTSPDVSAALTVLDAPAPQKPPATPLAGPAPSVGRTANLSASIDAAVRDRIDAIAYEQKLGKTAIVEGALAMLFEGRTNSEIADVLRERGHGFRRRS